MKPSKKEIAKFQAKEQKKLAGRAVNSEEDKAWERLKAKLENSEEMMAVFKRMKDR
jgi:hypothetical protein